MTEREIQREDLDSDEEENIKVNKYLTRKKYYKMVMNT